MHGSHLLQMRGLKQSFLHWWSSFRASHLLQMRGLKHFRLDREHHRHSRIFYRCVDWNLFWYGREFAFIVASFTDAWIETINDFRNVNAYQSHLLQMRGLKLLQASIKFNTHSRIFYRCVDWNRRTIKRTEHYKSRIFYRCVDWNIVVAVNLICSAVASFTDAWIETKRLSNDRSPQSVASFTDAWIETSTIAVLTVVTVSHLLQMRGLKQYPVWNMIPEYKVASFTDAWIETYQSRGP